MLDIRELNAGYGEKQVLYDVSIEVPHGSIVSIVGSNGAGKTTLLGTVMGVCDYYGGSIRYAGSDLVRLGTRGRIRSGIRLAPQGAPVFGSLTVLENLEVSAGGAIGDTDAATLFRMFPNLERRADAAAAVLSGGERQMLAIAMALASKPSLLLLDEPSGGLAPAIVNTVFEHIRRINRELQVTVLLVEQNVRQAIASSQCIYVMREGRITDTISEPSLDDVSRLAALA
jgi:branched-chain amino acid transport system ATP-binding protein